MPLYFLALLAPEKISTRILEWKQYMKLHFGCRNALKSPAHITLVPPFEMEEEKEPELKKAILDFGKGLEPFSVDIKDFGCFEPRVVFAGVLPNDRLSAARKKLEDTLLAPGTFPVKKEERRFHPHMTIASRDLHKRDFKKAWGHFQAMAYEERFTAENISLLKHNGSYWEESYSAAFLSRSG